MVVLAITLATVTGCKQSSSGGNNTITGTAYDPVAELVGLGYTPYEVVVILRYWKAMNSMSSMETPGYFRDPIIVDGRELLNARNVHSISSMGDGIATSGIVDLGDSERTISYSATYDEETVSLSITDDKYGPINCSLRREGLDSSDPSLWGFCQMVNLNKEIILRGSMLDVGLGFYLPIPYNIGPAWLE